MLGRLLFRFLAFGLLAFFVARAIRGFLNGFKEGAAPRRPVNKAAEKGQLMVRDPVCGTFVVPARAIGFRDRSGMHYFCSDTCRQTYESGH